jgi:hypothetical protein
MTSGKAHTCSVSICSIAHMITTRILKKKHIMEVTALSMLLTPCTPKFHPSFCGIHILSP